MRRSVKHDKYIRGFTMIEMVIVLVVLFIVSAVFISRYTTADSNELMAETDGLKASLRFAHIRALNDDMATWGINFPNGTSYTLYKNGSPAVDANGRPVMIPDKILDAVKDPAPNNTHHLQGNVNITSGVGTTVTFDKWGSPGVSNISITLTQGTQSSAVSIIRNTGFIP
jgi:prepilin-type N-terminal cleavage/methylation domain-containing protein